MTAAPLLAAAPIGGLGHDITVLAERDARRAFSREGLFSTVLQPLLFFGVFYCTFGGMLAAQGIDYGRFVTPTLVVQAVMFVAIGSATALSADRTSGLFSRLRTMPIGSASLGLSRLLVVAAEAAVTTVVLTAVAHLAGFRFAAGPLAALGFVLVAVLFAAALAAATATVALTMTNQEAMGAVLFLPYLPLLILSTGFVPAELFPAWLQPIVSASPISAVVEALRALSTGVPSTGVVLVALAWIGALLLIFSWTTARAFRKVSR